MNGSIRVSAKTIDDAITEALIQLGVTSDRLEYEVIEKGSAGFLGIGMKQAVIEARRKPEPVVDEQKSLIHEKNQEVNTEIQSKSVKEVSKSEVIKKEVKKEAPPKEGHGPRHESELAEVKEETKKAVESFLNDTLKAMGMTVELISDVDSDGALSIEMKGSNMGILIGKRGQTLDSLQYLANRVANKHQDGYIRVKLDTENYRARREETLKNLAKNIAYKVKRSKRPVSLEPMNPYERRIIHAALQSDSYVTTHSEGEEPYRKVVVTLKR
ncbi:RNA-binding cell elongation regulator Jag/EloR [Luxibacter massiliensis]|uniref:RNA-binding cell elongation regulator Jag/EloR n=1 Tax=Luxibacter massiliensis TaxID=2219695 RepID=UPI000F06AFD8|nr:RNA-binding cell elongation regulator Jag/EloR [Luxibacter massiliensis]